MWIGKDKRKEYRYIRITLRVLNPITVNFLGVNRGRKHAINDKKKRLTRLLDWVYGTVFLLAR